MFLDGVPKAAYPRKVQAEVYASGFARTDAEIRPLGRGDGGRDADEIAWLIERPGDGTQCACGHDDGWHTAGGTMVYHRGRCTKTDCGCLFYNPVGQPHWYDGIDWTTDHAKALRFARKVDAERAIQICDWEGNWCGIKATEHMWCASSSETTPPTAATNCSCSGGYCKPKVGVICGVTGLVPLVLQPDRSPEQEGK